MKQAKASPSPYSLTMKQNSRILGIWTIGWTLTVALVTFGHKFLWNEDTLFTSLALGLNLLAGVGLIIANIHFLKGLDEVQRRVQVNAMGMALGVTLILGMFYAMLDQTDMIAHQANISYLIILMSLAYIASIAVGNRYYR